MNKVLKPVIPVLLIVLVLSVSAHGQTANETILPKVISVEAPIQPEEAKVSGLGGKVNVRLLIGKDGRVKRIEDAFGPDGICPGVTRPDVVALRNAARKAAENATFSPGTQNGKPVETYILLGFNFRQRETSEDAEGREALRGQGSDPLDKNGLAITKERVLNGKAKKLPAPPYPSAAKAVKASGAVQVHVIIEGTGKIFSAEATSGHPLLRPAAMWAACRAEFTPTLLDGQPIIVSGIVTYNFVR
ncbi:hypothetical protein BH24ACI3_BH24ACI3_03880 [soil metagenome]